MRDYKFRGIDVEKNEWHFGDLANTVTGHDFLKAIEFYDENGNHYIHIVKPETIGQYTGIKDKNGVEIYEGDIVLYHPHNGFSSFVRKDGIVIRKDGLIYYSECEASFKIKWKCSEDFMAKPCNVESLEVIGNMHENPELL